MANQRPGRRFTQIVNAGPEKLSGIRRVITQRQPDRAVVAILGAENFARRFLFMGGEDFILTIVLSHYIEQISQAIIVIMAHVGSKQALGYRSRSDLLRERATRAARIGFAISGLGVSWISLPAL